MNPLIAADSIIAVLYCTDFSSFEAEVPIYQKYASEIFSISGAEPYRDGKAAARVQSGYEDSHADRAHWISG